MSSAQHEISQYQIGWKFLHFLMQEYNLSHSLSKRTAQFVVQAYEFFAAAGHKNSYACEANCAVLHDRLYIGRACGVGRGNSVKTSFFMSRQRHFHPITRPDSACSAKIFNHPAFRGCPFHMTLSHGGLAKRDTNVLPKTIRTIVKFRTREL